MRLLDLFSGIGGFSLAAQWVWGDELEIVAFCEIDKFCQKVLKKHWPEVPIIEDIKTVKWIVENPFISTNGRTQAEGGQSINGNIGPTNGIWVTPYAESKDDWRHNAEPEGGQIQELGISHEQRITIPSIDILTGGFPCQPFSCAGKRGGTTDDRWLWPEMLRAIHEVKPCWIVAENVSGLLSLQDGMVFEGVCTDLETEGYEVQPIIIPACAVDAPHRRDRVWIIGYSNRIGCLGNNRSKRKIQDENTHANRSDCHDRSITQDPLSGGNGRWDNGNQGGSKCSLQTEGSDCHAPDANGQRSQIGKVFRQDFREEFKTPIGNPWQEHWYEVATRLCRVGDGVSRRMDRVNRLKALGNSIVPQIAFQIFRAIKGIEGN